MIERFVLVVATALASGRRLTLPNFQLDPSWRAGLAIARDEGLKFGDQIDFTYGPWGWLDVNVIVSRAFAVGPMLFGLLSAAFFVGVMWTILCMRLSRTSALFLLFPAVALSMYLSFDEILLAAMFGAALIVVQRFADDRPPPVWWVPAMGSLAALMLMVKFSTGVFAVAVVACVSLLWWRSPRRLAAIAAVMFISIPAWWYLSEFSFEHFWQWFASATSISLGYSGSMEKSMFQPLNYVMFLGLVGLIIVLAVRWIRAHPSRRTAATVLCLLLILSVLVSVKMAFVREEQLRVASIFTMLIVVVAWLVPPTLTLTRRLLLPLIPAVMAIVIFLAPGPWHHSALEIADVTVGARAWWHNVELVVSPSVFDAEVEEARSRNASVVRLSDGMVETLRSDSIQIDPWQTSLAWTYGLRWSPVPVFQTYVVATNGIDRVNTDALDSRTADQRILIDAARDFVVDDRLALWSSPRYQLALTCRFHLVEKSGVWELWAKTDVDRCGETTEVSTQRVTAGHAVAIPAPQKGFLTIARYTPDRSILDRALSVVFKPLHQTSLTMSGTRIQAPSGLSGAPLLVSCPPAPKLTERYDAVCPGPTELIPSDDGRITFERIAYSATP